MSEGLPSGWVTTSIGDICLDRVTQGVPAEEPVPYVDIGSIDRFSKRIGDTGYVTGEDAPTRARQWVHTDDVLVSMTRPNLNAVAKVGPELDGAVASTGFDVLRPVGIAPGWIFYRVRTNEFIADVCEDLQGVVYPAIRPHDVRRHKFPLPPLPEQRRIVEAIESHLTRLDDAMATLERVQRNLKRYRASVLKAAVEGLLVPTEAELARADGSTYEPASVLLERILAERRGRWEEAELAKLKAKGNLPKNNTWKAKYVEPAGPDTSVLPELPEGWCWATVDQLIAEPLANGRSVKTASTGFPVLRLTALRDGAIDLREQKIGEWTAQEAEKFLVRSGDFLVARGNGSIRLVGIGGLVPPHSTPVAYPDTMIRICLCDGIEPRLFMFVWNSSLGRTQVETKAKTTAGIYKVNQDDLSTCLFPLPPAHEQCRIQSEIERLFSVGDATIDLSAKSATRCARLRQSILKWAFEGRLVDQDPTDEPAAVLLERIQAERAAAHAKAPRRTYRVTAKTPKS